MCRRDSQWETAVRTGRSLSSELCDALDGWGGARGPQEGGDTYVLTADSLHCTAEPTIVKQLYANWKLIPFKNYENYGSSLLRSWEPDSVTYNLPCLFPFPAWCLRVYLSSHFQLPLSSAEAELLFADFRCITTCDLSTLSFLLLSSSSASHNSNPSQTRVATQSVLCDRAPVSLPGSPSTWSR